MVRFVLLTCWLIGAGGGWGLGLAGLNAMGTGAGSGAELVLFGGASSWAAMLVTALRPGKRPNLWQRVFTGLAWLMPLGMFMLGDAFGLNVRLFSVLAAFCVTMIVVIYPSQSPQPRLDEGRRLAMHMQKQEAKQAQRQAQGPSERQDGLETGSPVPASLSPSPPVSRAPSPDPPDPPDAPAPRTLQPDQPSQGSSSRGARPRPELEQDSRSRWQTPQVRRRGKLRDDRDGGSRTTSGERRR